MQNHQTAMDGRILMTPLTLVLFLVALQANAEAIAPPAASEAEAATVHGIWLDEDGEAAIEIAACEAGICGEIVWLREPLVEGDKPKLDIHNGDRALRDRPILGLRLLEGFRPDGPGRWTGGRIYDPNNGKSYRCKLELEDGGETLKIRGYVLTPLLGRTTRWARTQRDELPSPRGPAPSRQ